MIEASFTAAYITRRTAYLFFTLYFSFIGFVALRADEEKDAANEINDFVIMCGEHANVYEGGPIGYRLVAIIAASFLVSEE